MFHFTSRCFCIMLKQLKDVSYIFKNLNRKSVNSYTNLSFEIEKMREKGILLAGS